MKKLIPLVCVFLLFFACKTTKKRQITTNNDRFPEDWQGDWIGTLDIYSSNKKVQSLPMAYEIHKIDTAQNRYTFALVYGEDRAKGLRPYELVIKDAEKGWYVYDEKNTIAMESYFLNNKLYSVFEVEGTLLVTSLEKQGEKLIHEIIAGNFKPVSVTGNQIVGKDTISAVTTYPIRTLQKATLVRKKR